MSYVAIFDIGTTAIKGLLVNKEVQIFHEQSVEISTYTCKENKIEQDPDDWWNRVKQIAHTWWDTGISPNEIKAITFSGQMEDVITLSKSNQSYRAILYSDTRADQESAMIKDDIPKLSAITGNNISPTTPLAKLIWLKKHARNQYEDAHKFVFSAKDYIIHQLTNIAVTDHVTATTTGMMDLRTKEWASSIIHECDVDFDKLPELLEVSAVVGQVSEEASNETGFTTDTIVINGSGDAGSSTLGAGAVFEKDSYFYLGTTGWLAVIENNEKSELFSEGHFNLAFVQPKQRISVAPLLNVGNVHHWAVNTFANGSYEEFEKLLKKTDVSDEIYFLPYLNGERNPVMDPYAKGAYWGIGPNTERKHLARAVLEGVTFSLKQTLLMFQLPKSRTITLIGGGSKSKTWCQMMADIMNHPTRVPLNNEYLPSLGIASTAFIALGWTASYEDFIQQHIRTLPNTVYEPIPENVDIYEQKFQTFRKLYPALTTLYT